MNDEVLANHFGMLEKFVKESSFWSGNVFNLDERGLTLDKECADRLAELQFLPERACKQKRTDMAMAEFSFKIRVTMMRIASAAGAVEQLSFFISGQHVQ